MKVTKIIDAEFKSGEKNGKKWTMRKIEVEGGKEATGFGMVAPGDEVDLTFNEQYKNYSFKLLKEGEIPSHDVNEDLQQAPVNNREQQVTRNMVWKNLLGHAGVPNTEAEIKTFMKLVDLHTKYLLGEPQVAKKSLKESWAETKDTVVEPEDLGAEDLPPGF